MSMTLADVQDASFVEADLNYLTPMAERPRVYTYEPPHGVVPMNMVHEPHRSVIRNLRPLASDITLDRQGFALVSQRSAVTDFYNESSVRDVYYAETERLLRETTGVDRVVIFDHTIRRRLAGVADRSVGTPRQPVPRVHVDHTERSGPQRVRDLLPEEAEGLLRGRVQIVNVWRPIRGPLLDAPLAVCDARSVNLADLVPSDLIYPNRVGETYQVTFSPAHRWFYAPSMRSDEALLLKCYDSARDGRSRFSPHTAFEDPTTPADAPPRESIEIRALLFSAG